MGASTFTTRNLTSGGSTTDANSFTTASITPRIHELQLLAVTNSHAAAATLPTVSGWTQVATVTYGSFYRLTLFRRQQISPSAGTQAIDFGGVTQTTCQWSIDGFGGPVIVDDAANNGAAALGNSQTGTASAAAITINYPSTPLKSSAGYAAFSNNGNTAMTPRTNWTEINDAGQTTPTIRLETQRRLVLNTETAGGSTTSITGAGIIVEIFMNPGLIAAGELSYRRRMAGILRR